MLSSVKRHLLQVIQNYMQHSKKIELMITYFKGNGNDSTKIIFIFRLMNKNNFKSCILEKLNIFVHYSTYLKLLLNQFMSIIVYA